MITISQAVEAIIKVKPFISDALSDGLINISALARQIQPEIDRITSYNVCYTKLLRSFTVFRMKHIGL